MSTVTKETLVKTRICMISDTHGAVPCQPEDMSSPFRLPLPPADVLLHAGDLTMTGTYEENQASVDMLKNADAELKLVIAGNHDLTLDTEYYNTYGYRKHWRGREDLAKIRDLYCGESALQHGIVYMEEGLRTFTLKNGACFTVYATPYQPEFFNWAFGYKHHHDRFNPPTAVTPIKVLNPVPSHPDVHIMLTHGPPKDILDTVQYGERVGCPHLLKAVKRAKPLIHCFGHIHEAYGAMRMNWNTDEAETIPHNRDTELQDRCARLDLSGDSDDPAKFGVDTLFVNAAIMTLRYRPLNAPWVVDIDLPQAVEGKDITE